MSGALTAPFAWYGGKQRLPRFLLPLVPEHYDACVEPFFGACAMYWRLRELKAAEADLSEQIERSQGPKPLPLYLFKDESLQAIGDNLPKALLSPDSGVAKRYLNLFARRIELERDEVRIEMNVAAMLEEGLQNAKARTASHEGAVLAIGDAWLPGADSNHQPNG